MSGIETLVKAVMRAAGVPKNPVEIVDMLLEGQGHSRPELLAMVLQVRDLALDYHKRLAQIELLLAALCANAGISVIPQLENSNGHQNTDDADDGRADDGDDGRADDRRRNARDG